MFDQFIYPLLAVFAFRPTGKFCLVAARGNLLHFQRVQILPFSCVQILHVILYLDSLTT